MIPSTRPLFEPLNIGSLELPARIFKTATAETRASENGFVGDELLAFYEPMARAKTPLIITGNMYVNEQGRQAARMCGADHDDKIPGLRRLTDLVHEHGSRIFAQLNHCGRQVIPHAVGLETAVSASDVIEKTLCTKPRALTTEEIDRTVQDFAAAAERCAKAGFDGVQIHAAHGYLLNQFLTPYTNRRDDEYGGSLENRIRLLVEVYRAIRKRVGNDYPVILKLNGSDELPLRRGLRPAELIDIARAMEREGIDAIEISVGHYESGFAVIRGKFWRFFPGLMRDGAGPQLPWLQRVGLTWFWPLASLLCSVLWPHYEGFNLKYARRFKSALSIPVICVGGFLSREEMEKPIVDGRCDAVSCARSMIADPYLFQHVKTGEQGPRCIFCNACIARAGHQPADCYHPAVSLEKAAMLKRMA